MFKITFNLVSFRHIYKGINEVDGLSNTSLKLFLGSHIIQECKDDQNFEYFHSFFPILGS